MIRTHLLVFFVIVLSIILPSDSFAAPSEYSDVDEDFWAEQEIEFLAEEGIVSGYKDGTFRPNDTVKRSQAALMLAEALDLRMQDRPDPGFSDIDTSSHGYEAAAALKEEGIIGGKNGAFMPNDAMTRGQMAAVLNRSFDFSEKASEAEVNFSDIEEEDTFYHDVQKIARAGITSGYEDNTYGPNDSLTRAQFSVFLARALAPDQRVGEEKKDVYINARFGFKVTYPAGWPDGEEAENGDGKLLYKSDANNFRSYGTHYMEKFAPDLSEYEEITLANGTTAHYKETKTDQAVTFDMVQVTNGTEFHVSGEVTSSFFEREEEQIRETILSFEVLKEEEGAKAAADRSVEALKEKNMEVFAEMVHPDKGVRFSPYAYVDTKEDLVFSKEEVTDLWEGDSVYVWGNYDGSGHLIELTFADYYEEFIYDRNFAKAKETSINERLGEGNTIDNSRDVYPDAVIVEYHFPGEGKYPGMDWKSLRLAMKKQDGEWFVVGVIHDEWTI